MTFYAVTARFKPDTQDRREALSQEFMAHGRQPFLHLRLQGSLLGPDGEKLGLLLLMEADARAVVERYVEDSPYARAGLYEALQIDELVLEAGRLS